MTELILDIDHCGRSFAFDEQCRTFYFNHRLPESVLGAVVGAPLASVVECGGDYASYSGSIIVSAANEDDWVVLCIERAD